MSEHETTAQTQAAAADTPALEERSAAGLERRLLVALGGGVLLGTAWIGGLLGVNAQIAQIPAFLGALILVIPLLSGAWKEISTGRPGGDALATLAVLAAMASEMYLAAGFLALFLWAANLILSRTAWGAQRAIRDLVHLTPDTARRITESGEEETVSLSSLNKGDVVRVRPGENLPVDGRVVKGASDINQASLTGEAVPVEVGAGLPVYAGTTNLTGQIDIEVTAVAAETTIGKVEALIREAESSKTRRQEIIEQLAGYYFWVVLMVAALVWFFATRSGEEAVPRSGLAPRHHGACGHVPGRPTHLAPHGHGRRLCRSGTSWHHDQADSYA